MNIDLNTKHSVANPILKNSSINEFSSNGKILLTSEYFIMDGAPGVAFPLTVGQKMVVSYRTSFDPHIIFKSYSHDRELWFSAKFDIWQFKIIETSDTLRAELIQKILRMCRKINTHFLYESSNVILENFLDFPYDWGLGSSSTLINNLCSFARVNPYQVLNETIGGSGYDLACAQSINPLLFTKNEDGQNLETLSLKNWNFIDQLYFVYLGRKQSTQEGISYYKKTVSDEDKIYAKDFLTNITNKIINCSDLGTFIELLKSHEEFISSKIKLKRIQDLRFNDFNGVIKSCGAWNGDFVLVASTQLNYAEIVRYFNSKNLKTIIPFTELIKINHLQ